jgi:hypothetical protein
LDFLPKGRYFTIREDLSFRGIEYRFCRNIGNRGQKTKDFEHKRASESFLSQRAGAFPKKAEMKPPFFYDILVA